MGLLLDVSDAWDPDAPAGPAVTLARIGDSEFELPRLFSLTQTANEGEPGWQMTIEVIDGVPQCRSLLFDCGPNDREIRSTDLRAMHVEDMLEFASRQAAFRRVTGPDGETRAVRELDDRDSGASLSAVRKARRAARRTITDDILATVADVYRTHVEDRPTQAVARHFKISDRTARLYVRRARDAGRLGEARPGKAGEL